MDVFEKFLWILVGWTLVEGFLVVAWPSGMIRLTHKLLRKRGEFLTTLDQRDLRKIGAVELCFSLLLGGYLLWAA